MIEMTIDEMRKFVDNVSSHKVEVKLVPIRELAPFAGISQINDDGSKSISVTKGVHRSLSGKPVTKSFIRAFLLHELGHLNTTADKDPHVNEYRAHLWAIEKGLSLGYQKVVATLREEIIDWQNLEDTEDFAKYRKASKLYLEEVGFVI